MRGCAGDKAGPAVSSTWSRSEWRMTVVWFASLSPEKKVRRWYPTWSFPLAGPPPLSSHASVLSWSNAVYSSPHPCPCLVPPSAAPTCPGLPDKHRVPARISIRTTTQVASSPRAIRPLVFPPCHLLLTLGRNTPRARRHCSYPLERAEEQPHVAQQINRS